VFDIFGAIVVRFSKSVLFFEELFAKILSFLFITLTSAKLKMLNEFVFED
jgi:hypothetical protein